MALNLYLDKVGGNIVGALAGGNRLIEYHIEKINKNQKMTQQHQTETHQLLPAEQVPHQPFQQYPNPDGTAHPMRLQP